MDERSDPRSAQIAVLSALLVYGVACLDFEVAPGRAALTIAAALAAQLLCSRLWKLPRFDPKSALISGLSLSLLLRTSELALVPAVAGLAIVSKFALRWQGRHIFNPTCFALVAMLALTDSVWVSAGQWGSAALFAFAAAGLGMLVLHRTARSDVTWAFLAAYTVLRLGRSLWLGEPLAIPFHGVQSGALLIFAFFMISDPKTVPAARAGRIVFAVLVAAGAMFVQFGLYRTNGPLWALACAAPLVPLLDRLFHGAHYEWSVPVRVPLFTTRKEHPMHRLKQRVAFTIGLALSLALLVRADAEAFCGFYVAKADTKLFNKASQVVLVRDGDRTVITMSNDFQGEPEEFAMVIPVPTFVEREQIHVGDRAMIEHLDAYTAPRLVEYFDPDPCAVQKWPEAARADGAWSLFASKSVREREGRAEGVTIEASYTVGEYDILILSAEQSDGLARWLRRSGYRLPAGAEPVLESYLKQDMRFFVAKVNLAEQSRLGFSFLRPLQVAYESPKFMLPIRLGMLNADGTQELFIYTLTRKGRVETTNYRTSKLPTGTELPVFVKGEFGDFYTALFDEQVRRDRMSTVFTEYAWDMNWCDPCAADPLSHEELKGLGVFWLGDASPKAGSAREVFVTRLHVRYDAEHFPADLVFQETGDRTNFQGRYVLRHAFEGEASCAAGDEYRRRLSDRQEEEARRLATLTGWKLTDIRRRIGLGAGSASTSGRPWWETLWPN